MRSIIKIFSLAMFLGGFANAEYLGTYYAKLSTTDHFNSSGHRLTHVYSIIRQDRYNYHIRGIRQFGDTGDNYFYSKENRATMERMLRRGSISASARRAIVNGTPLIRVEIYRDHINVRVARKVPRSIVE